MGKYLKKFDTHSEYESYITGSDKILPNVSYCEDNNDVHYNPWTDPRVIAKFNVTSTDSATKLCDDISLFSEMEIDGVVQPNVVQEYTFETTGEHTVKYTLLDPTSIGDYAFYECSGLTSITIPSGVTSIGEDAFVRCTSLTSITIPSGVTSIGEDAFVRCTSLTSITIPSSVTSIGDYVFNNCSGLTSIRVESDNTVYDSRGNCNAIIETATNTLLYGCQNTIIPSGVTSIGERAFAGCSGLTSINIPSSVISIGDNAFMDCSGLTSINIPNSVTSIGYGAFYECSGLTSITIPSSVTTIGNFAFYKCSGLTSITSLATTAPTIKLSTFNSVKTGGTLYVPSGSTGYNVWMGTGDNYLGKYNWQKVEQ